ncbi:MFS transporter [Novosphingobium album (ex Hu et al. 2023)]|uniref:MFS transporter n=1 Tax=Novosphingobium album (ex Hu et al. 2023) TaxID=2930093 RepID=A0ABT0B6P9_9SPHN|nr:MFS transporter [Novosphingobium album (ex Hu et al. 2023)]MCJ2180740.1 MFS transporter [Novosphingobium album (ex Hu et al. 2023)]
MVKIEAMDKIPAVSPALVPAIGITTATLVANLYFAQPLARSIGQDLAIDPAWAGSVVSAIQIGYALGLFLIVPLADFVENKRLVLICIWLVVLGTIGLAAAPSAWPFLAASLLTGLCASVAQVLVPLLADFVDGRRRGKVIGTVSAGVLLAVMLARPVALFCADAFGWRTIFWVSGAAVAAVSVLLARFMPTRHAAGGKGYLNLRQMVSIFANERLVRRRALYQAMLFGSFTMFWAAIPLMLHDAFGLSQAAVGLFALVAVGGVIAAPLAGRCADRGLSHSGTIVAALSVAAAFLGSIWAERVLVPAVMALMAILIDGAIQASQTFSRLIVLEVAPEVRGRVNAMYMSLIYSCGAAGSVVGVWTYVRFGWSGTALTGAALGLGVVLLLLLEPRNAEAGGGDAGIPERG